MLFKIWCDMHSFVSAFSLFVVPALSQSNTGMTKELWTGEEPHKNSYFCNSKKSFFSVSDFCLCLCALTKIYCLSLDSGSAYMQAVITYVCKTAIRFAATQIHLAAAHKYISRAQTNIQFMHPDSSVCCKEIEIHVWGWVYSLSSWCPDSNQFLFEPLCNAKMQVGL